MCLIVSPRAAALRILIQRAGADNGAPESHSFSLAGFQQEAVSRALQIIQQRNGVIIADSVGLGKTFVAAALLESVLVEGGSCAVVLPAAMKSVWRVALKPLLEAYPDGIVIITHGQLSRRHTFGGKGLVVVDEAHAFRSPHTRRYRSLRRSCMGSRVVLLTATPVNNSLSDLYFQLRIYARDDAFRDMGIGSLAALLMSPEADPETLHRLRTASMIRRTRADVKAKFSNITLPDGSRLRFPEKRELVAVRYSPPMAVGIVGQLLSEISFVIYRDAITGLLVRLSLLKRLQSSAHALMTSVQRLIAFHERFIASLRDGRLLVVQAMRGETEQLFFPELILEEIPAEMSVDEVMQRAVHDLGCLQTLRRELSAANDHKVDALIELLVARDDGAKTIIFTEFRDTADHLCNHLRTRFQVGLITGNAAWVGAGRATRMDVLLRFAPLANGAKPPPSHEAISVLIATDVLAEGLNLQDADAMVSYDLPWNPVRLIQRAGRIDRIGSIHTAVKVYNFFPDREFDVFLGLVRTIRRKLADIRSAVGSDASVLDPDDQNPAFLADLAAGKNDVLNAGAEEWIDDSDQSEAAPIGSISALAGGRRSLVCWRRNGSYRELVVDGSAVHEDHQLSNALLRRALKNLMVRSCDATSLLELCRDHFQRERCRGLEAEAVARICGEIQRAISRLGLLATPEVISAADSMLKSLPGFLGSFRNAVRRLRDAGTPALLLEVLSEMRMECNEATAEADMDDWMLIAAIICD